MHNGGIIRGEDGGTTIPTFQGHGANLCVCRVKAQLADGQIK
jgi:hypothetical protein